MGCENGACAVKYKRPPGPLGEKPQFPGARKASEPSRAYPVGDGTYAADLVAPTMVIAPPASQGRPENQPTTSSQWGVPVGASAPVSNAWDSGSSVDVGFPSPAIRNEIGDQSTMVNRSKGQGPYTLGRTVYDQYLAGDKVPGSGVQSNYEKAYGSGMQRNVARPAMRPAMQPATPTPTPGRSQNEDNTTLNVALPEDKVYGSGVQQPFAPSFFLKRSGELTPLRAPWTRSTSTLQDIEMLSDSDLSERGGVLSGISPAPAESTGIPAELRMIAAETERRANEGGGAGGAGGATGETVPDATTGDLVEFPRDMRAIFSANDWSTMGSERRQEAIQSYRNPTRAMDVFKGVLDVAGITLRTWLTMDERDRAARREDLDRAANTRHQTVMEEIQRQGGVATPQQSSELSALSNGLQGLLQEIRSQSSKGLSTGAIVGLAVGGVAVVGLLVLALRPRRNPSGYAPRFHGVSMRRRSR